MLHFPPFSLDLANACLWRGNKRILLPPTDFAVLHYLVTHPDQLVTHEELLKAVWPDTVVTKGVLKARLHRLRQVLGDNTQRPRFIETLARQGYRWIALLRSAPPGQSVKFKVQNGESPLPPHPLTPSSPLVGRETELARLHQWLEKAQSGARQFVFVTGEPGIGKTALLDAFLAPIEKGKNQRQDQEVHSAQLATGNWQSKTALIGRGQCIEQSGAGEAYLPVLQALDQLSRGAGAQHLRDVLLRLAPTWLLQLPMLCDTGTVDTVQQRGVGATQTRMLRELATALEEFTTEHAVVLVLEDLHWSDHATLELLAFLARRSHPTQMLLVGTYRPVEMLVEGHPLKGIVHELFAHQLATELALQLLSEEDIETYLDLRFPASVLPTRLAQVLHQQTEGNPLFVISILHDLITRGFLTSVDHNWVLNGDLDELATHIPTTVRHFITRQQERLAAEERRVLEAASVVGVDFSAAAVAAGVRQDMEKVEECCGALARREHFLRAQGTSEWPDGTVAARYSFLHALYQEVLYEQISTNRCIRLHRHIGERLERGYGTRTREVAAELALHFERGREYPKAIQYLRYAGENALQRTAHQEAITHLTKGLAMLQTLPPTQQHVRQELGLQTALGPAWMMAKGYAALETETTYNRAFALCQQVGAPPELPRVLVGLWSFYLVRARLHTARELGEQILRHAQGGHDRSLLSRAHAALGETLFHLGALPPARAHLEQGIECFDLQQRSPRAVQDPRVACFSYGSWTLWHLGYPEQARQKSQAALALAQELSQPSDLAFASGFAGWFYRYRRDVHLAHERAEATIALGREQGFPFWLAFGLLVRGWALAQQGRVQEGIAQMRQGLATYRMIGSEVGLPHILTALAELYGQAGHSAEGLEVLAEALALMNNNDNRYYEAEVYRLKGQLTLQCKMQNGKDKIPSPQVEAEECFHKAIEVARRQSAKSLELRAVMSLSRLWQRQGKQQQAHKMLREIYGWFTEGFDTADLQEAKTLLEELA